MTDTLRPAAPRDVPADHGPRRGRVVALLIGVGFIAAWFTGRSGLYVRPWFAPVLGVAGLALAIAAWRTPPAITRRAAAVLMLPVLAALGLTPGLVGKIPPSATAGPIPARLGDSAERLLHGTGGDVTLLDIALAEQKVGAAFLDGREVTVEATVDGPGRIGRLAMVCCAADARPVSIAVIGSLPPKGTWVRITGHLAARGGGLALAASSIVGIPTPENPFL
jgi:hypothetical protein